MSESTLSPADEKPLRVMRVADVVFELSEPSPQVHLVETEGQGRHLVIPMALPEGTALHQALNKVVGRRPTTHEFYAEMLSRLQAEVVAVRLTSYSKGVFYAELEVVGPRGREVLDCRPSDALILAHRQRVPAPVLCAEQVLAAFADVVS